MEWARGEATILSSKGQVVVPKALRDRRGWGPGTRLVAEETPDGVILRPLPARRRRTVEEVAGMLKHDGPPITDEQMREAIAAEVRRRHAFGRY